MTIRQVRNNTQLLMNCCDFEDKIDGYIANTIDKSLRRRMLVHQVKCSECAFSLQQHIAYLSMLSSWKEPKLDDDLKDKLLSSLDKNSISTRQKPYQLLKGFAGGFAAASMMALALFIGNEITHKPQQLDLAAIFAEDEYISRDITLVINVPEDMPEAELHFNLPAELSIVGQEHLTKVNVPISLREGENTIVIPIELESFAEYASKLVVDASLIYKNVKRDFALDLNQLSDLDTPQNVSDELIFNEADTKNDTTT